jgi:hypothetical protein
MILYKKKMPPKKGFIYGVVCGLTHEYVFVSSCMDPLNIMKTLRAMYNDYKHRGRDPYAKKTMHRKASALKMFEQFDKFGIENYHAITIEDVILDKDNSAENLQLLYTREFHHRSLLMQPKPEEPKEPEPELEPEPEPEPEPEKKPTDYEIRLKQFLLNRFGG